MAPARRYPLPGERFSMSDTDQQFVEATFRYVAFIDLLSDAAFNYELALKADNQFVIGRHARSAIVASALSIECAANCILECSGINRRFRDDLEQLSPIAKIEAGLTITGINKFDRGRVEVQRMVELVATRNAYVHPKTASLAVKLRPVEDEGDSWLLPFHIPSQELPGLKIEKSAMLWDAESALNVVRALAAFYQYLFIDVMKGRPDQIQGMLFTRLEVSGEAVTSNFDEAKELILGLRRHGADFSFLGIDSTPSTRIARVAG